MRRIIFSLLVVLLLVTAFPMITHAATEGDYEFKDNLNGTCTITNYNGSATDVNIPNSLGGLTVVEIGAMAFMKNGLTSVTIPNTITKICRDAFMNNQITSLSLPDDLVIEYRAFTNNTISTLNGAAFDGLFYSRRTSGVWDKSTLVSYGGSKKIIDFIPGEVVVIAENAFCAMEDLTSVTIPANVNQVGDYAFENSGITSLNTPLNLTYIGKGAFNGNAITTVNGVPSNGLFFAKKSDGTEDITKIVSYGGSSRDINFIPDSVTTLGESSFELCSLNSVVIPRTVGHIEDLAFFSNENLGNVTINEGLVEIGSQGFSYCSVSSWDLPNSLIKIGNGAFWESGVSEFILPGVNAEWASDSGSIFHSGDTVSVDDGYEIVLSCVNVTDGQTVTIESGKNYIVAAGAKAKLKMSVGSAALVDTTIACGAGVKLTIENINIDVSATEDACALSFTGSGNTLTLIGTSTLKSGENEPGIRVENGTELTISGEGTVNAFGKSTVTESNYINGAGIGVSSDALSGGTVRITSGTINATGGYNASGIGVSYGCSDSTTIITGGKVTANGGQGYPGIGGFGSTISITDGYVEATGHENHADDEPSTSGLFGDVVNISGGRVVATGGYDNPGISGYNHAGTEELYTISGDAVVFAGSEPNGWDIDDHGNGFKLIIKEYAAVFYKSNGPDIRDIGGGQTNLTTTHEMHKPVTEEDIAQYGPLPNGWDSATAGAHVPKSYTLSYDANGGTGVMSSQAIHAGATASLSTNEFKREGYTFGGWNSAKDGSGTTYADGADFTMGSANITLYAQWTAEASPTPTVAPEDPDAQTGVVSGTLEDSSGNPLVNYQVTIYSEPRTTRTDANGTYTFSDVPYTHHTLVVADENGVEKGRMSLNFTKRDTAGATVTGNTVETTYTEGTIKVDFPIIVGESGISIDEEDVEVIENPQTGGSSMSMLYLIIALGTVLIVSGFFLAKRKLGCK